MRIMLRGCILLATIFLAAGVMASQTDRQTGLRENTPSVFALANAEIHTAPGEVLRDATLVVRNGVIEFVGTDSAIPADAYVLDMEGRIIYPGFIDMATHYGMPEPGNGETHHWNPQIRSAYSSAEAFNPDEEQAKMLRSQGFVAVHTMPSHGILRGQGSIVSLGQGRTSHMLILPDFSRHISFSRSAELGGDYPTSAMGALALLRQSMLDAQWYGAAHQAYKSGRANERPEYNTSLEALLDGMETPLPFVIETTDEQWFLRAASLAKEFRLNAWIRGSGYEYRRIDAIRETALPVIVPVDFPDTPDISQPEEAIGISLETLRHWYYAPENPAILAESGLQIALTAHGSNSAFLENLQLAVYRGLDPDKALAALTTTPAAMVGLDNRYGALRKGMAASFIVTNNNIFDRGTTVEEVWVDGQRFIPEPQREEVRGSWEMASGTQMHGTVLRIEGNDRRLRAELTLGDHTIRIPSIRKEDHRISFTFPGDSLGLQGPYSLSAHPDARELLGAGTKGDGTFFSWRAHRMEEYQEQDRERHPPWEPLELPVRFPSMEYGISTQPALHDHVLIRNATVWTQGPKGIIENADMLVHRGTIEAVGRDLYAPPDAVVIDGTGMHLTPGLVDPHIHTSITGGVNETGDAITAETRIADVMHGDNVWIYRLLAGGITSANLFHGSANPIGGQSAVIKMRWGSLPGEMHIKDAAPGLKMALGENVKRMSSRYPSSRQGTEQIIHDAFQAAVEYGKQWERWEETGTGMPPRRDLQLEAILEVIRGERKAHVHAYRQDEMLMMMRLAERFGFTVGSFEHTLEGYKIADELREHGAGAVVWTDWSSFKVEAHDGILYNARLLNETGVLTSLHSDNTQLATRMNWEAAKTMLTGVTEKDAMNMITLHPAKILGIDHRTGSLEPGKDADFVLWNGHPMSTSSIALQTWVDGRKFFDRDDDRLRRTEVQQERALIIDRIFTGQHHQRSRKNEEER